MTAAYFEDHPTDPNKVILRKRSCPYCNDTPRTWVGLIRGVRVEGDSVVITVKNGNDAARELCGEIINEMEINK